MSATAPEKRPGALARFKLTLVPKSEPSRQDKKSKKEKKKKTEERPSLAARLDAGVGLQRKDQYLDIQDKEKLFSLTNYDPEQYVRQLIVSRSLEQAKEELRLLSLEHQTTDAKIKRKMFQSYQVFISQGSEIGGIEADLASMQATLVDLRAAAETLQGEAQLLQTAKDAHKLLSAGDLVEIAKKPTVALAIDVAALLDAQEELEVLLPMRRYPEAVAAIEKIRVLLKHKPALAVNSVTRRLEEHAMFLSSLLIAELRLPLLRSTATERLVSYLARLGMQIESNFYSKRLFNFAKQDKATTVFLDTASTALDRQLRQVSGAVRVQGNPTAYITEEAETISNAILTVCKDFKTLFPDPTLYGACLQWALAELVKFGSLLQKQLATLPEDMHLVMSCIAAVKNNCQRIDEVGVPLTMSVLETLDESLKRIWSDHTSRSLVAVQKAVEVDTGAARSQFTYHAGDDATVIHAFVLVDDNTTVRVTESGKLFNSLLLRFLDASAPILTAASVRSFTLTVQGWFSSYLSFIDRRIRLSPTLNDRQQLALLANGYYAAATLQERTWRLLEKKGGDESLYEGLSVSIASHYATVQRQLCAIRAEAVVNEKIDWRNHSYEDSGDAPTKPCTKVSKLYEWVCGTASAVAAIISPDSVVGFLADLLEETTTKLAAAGPWEKIPFGPGSLEQLLFDLQFLETGLAPVLTDAAKRDLTKCAELASKVVKSTSSRKAKEGTKRDFSVQVTKALAQLKSQSIALELPNQPRT